MTKKTMTTHSLLVELLTEELPPKALKRLGEAFAQGMAQHLSNAQMLSPASTVTSYATPRRLAVHITHVLREGPARIVQSTLMPVAIAFDATGQPTAALQKKIPKAIGFASYEEAFASQGGDTGFRRERVDGKEVLVHRQVLSGEGIRSAVNDALESTLKSLPIPKVMFYERDDGTPVHFVRPAHKLVALHGDSVLGVQALGLQAGRTTQGHRFHASGDIVVPNADAYEATLRTQGKVIAGFAERRAAIVAQLQALAQGDEIIMPDALLDEVTALVEWPKVYECHFDAQFLQVP
ncbi:MAG: glycine--tRNA ligase subunit beta, partial [Betaproteobacteria bacterium]|nr:glycine--tRNA ligase subunit beta [Betaproteobacteria bacterium]